MLGTAAHTAQSPTRAKQDSPKVTSPRARWNRRSAPSSPTTPSSTRSGSKDSKPRTPSKQNVSAALALVRARKGSPSPMASPRDENGMTKQASAFWSESLSPTSKTNRLPLTPKMQSSPEGQSSLTPVKQAASPPPTSPRTSQAASPMASSPDNRSPHQKFLLNSFASRAYAPTLPTLTVITIDQENERSDDLSLESERTSQRRSRFMAKVRNTRIRRATSPSSAQLSCRPCTTLDSTESSVLDPGSLAFGLRFVRKDVPLAKEAEAVSGPEKCDSPDTFFSAQSMQDKVDSAYSMSDFSVPFEDVLDPAAQKSLCDFIDRLNQKTAEELPCEMGAIVASSSSSDSVASVDPETLKEIACFIDSVSKKPALDQVEAKDDDEIESFSDEDVPAETRAGISAFIESLEKKKQTPTNGGKEKEREGELLYVSSSDETYHVTVERSSDKADLRAACDEIVNNRSDDHPAHDETANNRSGPLDSPHPSDLAGEHFLQLGNSKVSTEDEAIDEIENKRHSKDGLSGRVEESRDGDQLSEINDEVIEINDEARPLNGGADSKRVSMDIPSSNLSKSEKGDQFARILLMARNAVERVGDFDQQTEISGDVIEIGIETDSHDSAIANAAKAIAALNLNSSAEAGRKHEQDRHDVRVAVSEDEASYAHKAVKSVGDFDQHTEINGEVIEIGIEADSLDSSIVNAAKAIAALNLNSSAEKGGKHEPDRHEVRGAVSEDEASYLFNAFFVGSDMDLSIDPILHDPSTMKSIDEDENIERFLTKTFTLPEGASKEDLMILNSYIRQASILLQNGSTPEERSNLVKSAIRDGVAKDVTEEIFLWLTSAPDEGGASPTSNREHNAQEAKSIDEDESFDHFLRETVGDEAERSVEEEVGTNLLRINDDTIEISDTFERFLRETNAVEEQVGSALLSISDDSIEISNARSFLVGLNTSKIVTEATAVRCLRDTASESAASYLFNAFVLGSDMDESDEPIVPNPSTMKTVDEDEHNERYLAKIGNVAQKAQRAVEEVDPDWRTKIESIVPNPSTMKTVDEDEHIERYPADIENVSQKAQQSIEELENYQRTEIEPIVPTLSTMKSVDENEKIERYLVNPGNVAQKAQQSFEQVRADQRTTIDAGGIEISHSFLVGSLVSTFSYADKEEEQNRHDFRATVSEDEASYLFNAFVLGSDMDLSVDPILPDFSTMKSIDEDENIERFLTRRFTLPEGAAMKDLAVINSYIRQAGNMLQNGSTPKERENLVKAAIRDGVPKDLTEELFLWLASAPDEVFALSAKLDNEKSDDKSHEDASIFPDPTLPDPSTSTSVTDSVSEQLTAGAFPFPLTTSSIEESEDQSIEVTFDMGHSDMKEQIVTDEEEEEEGQARWVDDANDANPLDKSVLSEQQPTRSDESTAVVQNGPSKSKANFAEDNFASVCGASSGAPDIKEPFVVDFENEDEVQALGADKATEAQFLQKSASENSFASVSGASFGATYEKEEEEEVQGWGVANSLDRNVLPEHQRTAEKSITVDYDEPSKSKSSENHLISVSLDVASMKLGVSVIATVDSNECLSPTIDRYAFPPTPVKGAKEKSAASVVAALAVNAPQMKVVMPQESGALAVNLPPPPPSFPHPTSPKTREVMLEESERYALPPTPVSHIEEKTVVEARAVKLSPPPSPMTRAAVPRESYHAQRSLSPKSKSPISGSLPPFLGGGTTAAAIAMWSPLTLKGRRQRIPVTQQWKLSYKERTKNHPGYFSVNEHSLHETSVVVSTPHKLDDFPWEDRDVKQRFLHEHSVSFSRNWFGNLSRRRGNDRHREPVCRPQSMKMPMTRLPERDWEKEWYLTWQSLKLSHLAQAFDASSSHSSSRYSSGSDDHTGSIVSGSLYSESYVGSVFTRDTYETEGDGEEESESEDGSWCEDEDAPECGYIVNVKQKIGERVSRVHPEHTSSLRRSRWRKKHFPRGTFPY